MLIRVMRLLPPSLRWAIGLSAALHLVVFWQVLPFAQPRLSVRVTPVHAVLANPLRNETISPVSPGDDNQAAGRPLTGSGAPDSSPTSAAPLRAVPVAAGANAVSARKRGKERPIKESAASPPQTEAMGETARVVVSEPIPRAGGVVGVPSRLADVAPSGVDADEMRQYPFDLRVVARRFMRYPALARENGWQGSVDLGLVFRAEAGFPSVEILRSSGHDVLDEQARAMILHAVSATPLPPSFRGRDFRMRLPLEFSLEDSQ